MKKSYKQTSKALRGIVKKSNKSRGFYVDDSKYDSQFKLGKKELFKAMPGDLVQFSLTPKGWAKIDKVITENTSVNLLGRYLEEVKGYTQVPWAMKMI